jgi:protein disulfide-isomerase A1
MLLFFVFADGAFEEKPILQFVELHKSPLITVFTELNSAKVYSSPIKMQVCTSTTFSDLSSLLIAKKKDLSSL